MKRIRGVWWCELHQEIHQGKLEDFNMAHRMQIHPVFAEINTQRQASSRLPTNP